MKVAWRVASLLLAVGLFTPPSADASERRFGICAGQDHSCVLTTLHYGRTGNLLGWKIFMLPISVGYQVQAYVLPLDAPYRPYIHAGTAGVIMGGAYQGAGVGIEWRVSPTKRPVVTAQLSADHQTGYHDEALESWEDLQIGGSVGVSWVIGKFKPGEE